MRRFVENRFIPKSLLMLPMAYAVYYILTAFDLPILIGIPMMILMSDLWSSMIVYAVILGITAEVLSGSVVRSWLLVPAACLCVFMAVPIIERHSIEPIVDEFHERNLQVVSSDPKLSGEIYVSKNDFAASLIAQYDLPIVYSSNEWEPENYRSSVVVSEDDCKSINLIARRYQRFDIRTDRLSIERGDSSGFRKNRGDRSHLDHYAGFVCVVSRPTSSIPETIIEKRTEALDVGITPINLIHTTFRRSGHPDRTVTVVNSKPLIVPLFYHAGGTIDSLSKSWEPLTGWSRYSINHFMGQRHNDRATDIKVTAALFGLQPRSPTYVPQDNPDLVSEIASEAKAASEASESPLTPSAVPTKEAPNDSYI